MTIELDSCLEPGTVDLDLNNLRPTDQPASIFVPRVERSVSGGIETLTFGDPGLGMATTKVWRI